MKTKMIVKKIAVLVGMLMVLVSINGIGYAIVMEDGKDETKLPIIEERGGLARPDELKREEPEYAPGEVIIKLKEPAVSKEALFAQPYSVTKASHEDILSNLKSKYNLRDEKPIFQGLHNKLKAKNLSLQQLNAQEEAKLPQQAAKGPQGAKQPNLLLIYILKTDEDIPETCNKLKQDPDIEYAEPNYKVEIQMLPNDPYYSSSGSWGQPYDDLWGIKKLQCEQAWDISQGEGVIVAVIDTGVDYNHEDIAQNIWINEAELNGTPGVDDDTNGYVDDVRGYDFAYRDNNPMDGHGHGTHVSGTIAGIGNNNLGVIGVAPRAKIMAIKGLSDGGSGYISDLVNCIQYAADNGARVLSNSWGPSLPVPSMPTVERAIDYAYARNCVIVFAAGNNNDDVAQYSPANYYKVIAVAAANQNDEKCNFSNYGLKIAVSAPGGDSSSGDGPDGPTTWRLGRNILSLRASGTDIYANSDRIYYGLPEGICLVPQFDQYAKCYRARGTSMACPHVAGVAALILSANVEQTPLRVKTRILAGVDPYSQAPSSSLGSGRINAYKALTISPYPFFSIRHATLRELSGNGNQVAEANERAELIVGLENIWVDAVSVTATLSTRDPGITSISKSQATFGAIGQDEIKDNTNDPFIVNIGNMLVGESAQFSLTIQADTTGQTIIFPVIVGIYKIADVSTATDGYFSPRISTYVDDDGHISRNIVWHDVNSESDGFYMDIFAYNLEDNAKYKIGQTMSSMPYPTIYKNKVAWPDYHIEGGIGTHEEVFLYDLKTQEGTPFPVAYANHIYGYDGPPIALTDVGLSWLDTPPITAHTIASVWFYSFDTDEKFEIGQYELGYSPPEGSGDKIAWPDYGGGHLYLTLFDASTKETKQIAEDASLMTISGNKILWNKLSDTLCLYDATTGKNSYILSHSSPDMMSREYIWDIAISGNKIIYRCLTGIYGPAESVGLSDFYLYDLATNQRFHFIKKVDTPFFHGIRLEGNIAVLSYNFSIYVADINGAVSPSYPPKFYNVPSQLTVKEGRLLGFNVRASDADGDTIQYSIYPDPSEIPDGAIFYEYDNPPYFEWTPDFSQAGTYEVIFSANDGEVITYAPVTITVTDAPSGGLLTSLEDTPDPFSPNGDGVDDNTRITGRFSRSISWDLEIESQDGNTVNYWSGESQNVSIVWNGRDTSNFIVSEGTYTYRLYSGYISDDDYGYGEGTVTVIDTGAPELNPIGDKTIAEGRLLQFEVSATDPNGDVLEYSTSSLPRGAAFEPTTQLFSWRPDYTQASRYSITFYVSDRNGSRDSETIAITVTQNNEAYITSPSNGKYLQGRIDIVGSASLGGDFQRYELYYASWAEPQNMTLIALSTTPVSNGLLGVWDTTPCPDGIYTLILKVISTDGWEGNGRGVVYVIVDNINDPPTFASRFTDRVSFLGTYVTFEVAASDPDDPATPWGKLTYSANNLPQGAEFNSSTRIFSWERPETDGLTHTVTFTVADCEYTVSKDIKLIPAEKMRVWTAVADEYIGDNYIVHGEKVFYKLYKYLPDGTLVINYMYDLSMQKLIELRCGPEETPAVYGDRFVYRDSISGNPGIYMYDLSNNQERQITSGYSNYSPCIYANKVAWGGMGQSHKTDIFVYDLDTDQERQITTDSNEDGRPCIYGDKIVWQKTDLSLPTIVDNIYMYDLSTSQERQITAGLNRNIRPYIYGNKIIWQRGRQVQGGNNNWTVYDILCLYDLSTNQEVEIDNAVKASIYADKMVWVEVSGYAPNLYMYDIPANQKILVISDYDGGTPSFYDDKILWRNYYMDNNGDWKYSLDIIRFILPPQIASVEPLEAGTGTYFAIEGNYFGYTTEGARVLFSNGVAASIVDWSNHRIICQVPEGAQSGPLKVITIGGESNVVNVTIGSNNSPILDLIGDKAVDEGAALEFTISATDPDRNYLIYSASGIPEGAIFNPDTKIFNWIPNHSRAGTYQVTFSVSDGVLSDSETITITVNDTIPLINWPTNLAATPISTVKIKLTWQDNSDNETGFKIEQGRDGRTFSEIGITGTNVISYTVTDVTQGTYYFRVRAYNNLGNSDYSNIAICNFIPPIAPSNLTAIALSSTKIQLTWQDNSNNETGFKVEMSTDGATFIYKGKTGVDGTTFTITGLTADATYYFKVYAYNTVGNAYSEVISAATLPLPIAPSNLTTQALSSTKIKLTWQDNSDDETSFKVEMSLDGATFSNKASLGANVTTYTVTGLTANTTYYFRVRAVRGSDYSDYSEIIQGTTLPLPNAPSNLTATTLSLTKIQLNWQDNSTDETGFKVEMSLDGTTFTTKASLGANITTCAISGLTANTTYYFRAYSIRGADKSPYSEVIQATTTLAPAAPGNLNALAFSPTQIDLAWQDSSDNEAGFGIERSTDGANFTEIATVGPNITIYSDMSAEPDAGYYYRIYSYNNGGRSTYSNTVFVTTLSNNQPAPSDLKAIASSPTQIRLTWLDNSPDEQGFKIEKSDDGTNFTQIATVGADIKAYTAKNLTTGNTYYFRVRAYKDNAVSEYSNTASCSLTPPIVPTNLTAIALSSTKIKLTWQDNSDNEKGFKVEISADGTTFTLKGGVGIDKTIYTAGNLTPDTVYYFRIYAYNAVGKSYSDAVSGTTLPLPIAPSNLIAQALSSTKIKLTWQDNSSDETGFKVEMSTDGTTYVTKGSAKADITTRTISKLTPNTTYYFRVYAYRGTDKSAYSEVISGTTLPLPIAPSNLTAQALSSTQIQLSWQDNSDDEAGFKIEQSLDGAIFAYKGYVGVDKTTYTISGLTPGTTYYYRIYAHRGSDKSEYSNRVSATTQ